MVTLNEILNNFHESAPQSLGMAAISDLEKQGGISLPRPLRVMLQNFNGGQLNIGYTIQWPDSGFVGGFGAAHLVQFYGIDRAEHLSIRPLQDYFDATGHAVSGVPASKYVFADDWGGNPMTFDAIDGSIGSVDHETFGERFTDPETHWTIAEDFADLFQKLFPAE
ncbi:SMI1/KNR4 family protein [Aurantiacibacter sp. MUD61]|uniref:SMI1/KNR4 family protein n=1 Tax=Aurantiacibacter sp. MUD61 TaxID=3009083 RepID=UPI0022F07410|nr:SMI1/KNR4 family protein [Aurantiacibacter sp. MUD61]